MFKLCKCWAFRFSTLPPKFVQLRKRTPAKGARLYNQFIKRNSFFFFKSEFLTSESSLPAAEETISIVRGYLNWTGQFLWHSFICANFIKIAHDTRNKTSFFCGDTSRIGTFAWIWHFLDVLANSTHDFLLVSSTIIIGAHVSAFCYKNLLAHLPALLEAILAMKKITKI